MIPKDPMILLSYVNKMCIRARCDPTRYPYSYNENGEMKGIIPDYFRKIADYVGISYEFLTPATRDEYIAYQKNKETTDISIDARLETDNYAETKKWGITAPFITMQLARVTRRDFDGKINVVATVDQTASKSIEDALAPGAETLMCSTRPVPYTHLPGRHTAHLILSFLRKNPLRRISCWIHRNPIPTAVTDVYKRQQQEKSWTWTCTLQIHRKCPWRRNQSFRCTSTTSIRGLFIQIYLPCR